MDARIECARCCEGNDTSKSLGSDLYMPVNIGGSRCIGTADISGRFRCGKTPYRPIRLTAKRPRFGAVGFLSRCIRLISVLNDCGVMLVNCDCCFCVIFIFYIFRKFSAEIFNFSFRKFCGNLPKFPNRKITVKTLCRAVWLVGLGKR